MRLFALLLLSVSLIGAPNHIIIIPEAEGASWSANRSTLVGPDGPTFGEGLDAKGQRRATALVRDFFGGHAVVPKAALKSIACVIASKEDFRAIETLAPLANAIFPKAAPRDIATYRQENIVEYTLKEVSQIKEKHLKSGGRSVVICWKQEEIPMLIEELEPILKEDMKLQGISISDIFVLDYLSDKVELNVFKQGIYKE